MERAAEPPIDSLVESSEPVPLVSFWFEDLFRAKLLSYELRTSRPTSLLTPSLE